jgi:restriction endonuclease S subunit
MSETKQLVDLPSSIDVEERELPNRWGRERLGDIADVGWGDLQTTKKSYVSEGFLAYSASGPDGRLPYHDYDQEGVVLSAIGALCGKTWLATGKWSCIKNTMRILPTDDAVDIRFLSQQLSDPAIWPKRGTGQPFIAQKDAREIPVLVPPLDEQERIVEILEDQLSRLDTALQSVQTVRKKAAQFRRSLLHAAFTGALTGHDVEEGELPDGWEPSTLGQIAKWGSGGTPRSGVASYYGGNIPWAVIGDLTEAIVLTTEKSITEAGLAASSAKLIESGTVMIAMYGASIGRTGVTGREMATNQAIAFARINDKIVGRDFLLKYLQFQKSAFVEAGKGGAQPNISQTIIKTWPIVLPSLDEQERIVEILEDQLSRLDASMAVADAVEERSTALRRSLLHSAFTGRLTEEWREAVNV